MVFGSVWYDDDHFGKSRSIRDIEDLKTVDAVVLWGGEDISPKIYKQQAVHAYADNELSMRDKYEVLIANEAIRLGIPIIGVCRGAQLLCALAGGSLWQHVDNHVGRGHLITYKGKAVFSNSAHHQMMRPTPDDEILAVSTDILSPTKYADEDKGIQTKEPEPEVVYFPFLNAVGIQGHPEWLSYSHDLNVVAKDAIKEKLKLDVGF